jgi:clan AA aspartic protease
MVEGSVYGESDALVELAVLGPEGRKERLDFRVDTGFDGALTLHPAVVAALGLPPMGARWIRVGDGRMVLCDLFDAQVEWDGEPRPIDVLAADIAPLLGMELLGGHQLRIDVVDGGAVRITPLASPEP